MKKIISLIIISLFLNIKPLYASSELEEVRNFSNKLGNDIVSISKNKNLSKKDRSKKIINIIDNSVDVEWISRFILGKNYKNFSNGQKDEFKKLYRQFMINTYGPKFETFDGKKFDVISVEKQKIFYISKCEFLPANSNVPISFDFRVKKRNNKLVAIDFVAEGISLIEAQRSEFDSAISSKGVDGFLLELKEKVEKLNN